MKASQIRKLARDILDKNLGKLILTNLLYAVVMVVIGILGKIPFIGWVISFVLSVPLAYGYTANMIRIRTGKTDKPYEFFTYGMDNFSRSWSLLWEKIKKLILPVLIFILSIVAIIVIATGSLFVKVNPFVFVLLLLIYIVAYVYIISKFLLYSFSDYAAIYNEDMTTKDAVQKSEDIMNGNRLNFVGLELSFIGWALLSVCTLGIGFLFLVPYMDMASIVFYETLAGVKDEKVVEDNNEEKDQEQKDDTTTQVYEENVKVAEENKLNDTEDNNPIKPE